MPSVTTRTYRVWLDQHGRAVCANGLTPDTWQRVLRAWGDDVLPILRVIEVTTGERDVTETVPASRRSHDAEALRGIVGERTRGPR